MKRKLKAAFKRTKEIIPNNDNTPKETVPRITNDTVAEHREEVIGSAKKHIVPLAHSKHRIVSITIKIFIIFAVVFFGLLRYCFVSASD